MHEYKYYVNYLNTYIIEYTDKLINNYGITNY